MIDHIGFEVSDLSRSARFYDALFYPLGARRTFESEHAIAYGTNFPTLWIVVRSRPPAPGYGHVANWSKLGPTSPKPWNGFPLGMVASDSTDRQLLEQAAREKSCQRCRVVFENQKLPGSGELKRVSRKRIAWKKCSLCQSRSADPLATVLLNAFSRRSISLFCQSHFSFLTTR